MIQIICKSESYTYNAYHILKAFYPSQEVSCKTDEEASNYVTVQLPDGQEIFAETENLQTEKKRQTDLNLYDQLEKITGEPLAWGVLTGVRPTKLAMQKLEAGWKKEDYIRWAWESARVRKEKAVLAWEIAERERKILEELDYEEGYSLYVGIPFCPSVCSYCSFSSGPLDRWKEKVDVYVDTLCKELEFIAERSKNKKLNTIYIGGGTPTTLTAEQLERLMGWIDEKFSREHLLEYTVEAGRPDSITEEKLKVIKSHGITRISINPQTMNQQTLDLIGRKHTVEQIKNVYSMAREEGFNNINMDIILGLVGEDVDEVAHTLSEIEVMKPESLTVHSLAIKRAAALNIWRDKYKQLSTKNTDEIIRMTEDTAKRLSMEPYYMYRQKNMAGNFENVGYSVVGLECIYNILIMEEKQTIIACGAGASSKVVFHNEADDNHSVKIERIENVKDVRNYIQRIDEMIDRKKKFFEENNF